MSGYKNADGTWKYDDGMIPCGSVVKWAEKWSRPEERHERYLVVESYDKGALLVSLTTKCALGYMTRVEWEWVEVVEC